MKKTTLKDIADDTGYSISTISRGLNGSEKINIHTRKVIQESAEKLKYLGPLDNNNHAHNGFLKIALIISGFHVGEFYASFYSGFTKSAEEDNILLSITATHKPKEYLGSLAEELSKTNDKIILYAPEYNRNDYLQLKKRLPKNYPVISNGLIENPVFTTVTFDGYGGGHLAAVHFRKKRYYSCGVIKGPSQKAESRYRVNGFQDYINQHDSMELVWNFNGDFTFKSGTDAFKAFQAAEQKPRAIFACNDVMCHAFMEAAMNYGYKFPQDIAIMGYDNLPICERHQPTITSIATPYKQLGHITTKTLETMISGTEAQKGMQSFVPVTLKEREST